MTRRVPVLECRFDGLPEGGYARQPEHMARRSQSKGICSLQTRPISTFSLPPCFAETLSMHWSDPIPSSSRRMSHAGTSAAMSRSEND